MRSFFRSPVTLLVASFLLGLFGGVIAGWLSASFSFSPRVSSLEDRFYRLVTNVASSTSGFMQVIPIGPERVRPSYPSVFSARAISPVATLVRRPTGKALEDRLIREDQSALAQAVALTNDGWFATPYAAVGPVHLSDVLVIWNGQGAMIDQAVHDTATDVVFFKTRAQGVPAVAFVSANNVVTGASVWVEPSPKRLFPGLVTDAHLIPSDVLSSDHASRRFLVMGDTFSHAIGGGVWNDSGNLVGLLETKTADGWQVIPAGDLTSALSSLLSGQDISHAGLGVRTRDLSTISLIASDRALLPSKGAWVKTVNPNGPAEKMIQEGDVIERVERDILDGGTDLGERLLEYVPGSSIIVYGTRKGASWQGTIILGKNFTGEILK